MYLCLICVSLFFFLWVFACVHICVPNLSPKRAWATSRLLSLESCVFLSMCVSMCASMCMSMCGGNAPLLSEARALSPSWLRGFFFFTKKW